MGGLSKKAYQLKQGRAGLRVPSLTVDAGALLFKNALLGSAEMETARITAAGIVDAYNLMQFDALAVARHDLAAGLDFLLAMKSRASFPWLSANLVRKSTGEPLFTPSIIKKINNLSVGIIGITDPNPPSPLTAADDALVRPWQEVLPDLVAKMAQECGLIMVLANVPPTEQEKMIRTVPGIHLLIPASGDKGNEVRLIDKTLIAQVAGRGKYLGELRLQWRPDRPWIAAKGQAATTGEPEGSTYASTFTALPRQMEDDQEVLGIVNRIREQVRVKKAE